MIGAKKLKTIREQLRDAATDLGNDPIRRLEERLAAAEGATASSESDVLQSLRRILDGKGGRPGRKSRVGSKK